MAKYRYNRYRDVEIDVSKLAAAVADRAAFEAEVAAEYEKWASRIARSRESRTAVMWLSVPVSTHLSVVPWLVSGPLAFKLHHATESRVMLVRPHDESCAEVPRYGTHYAKVECVVLERGTGRALAVRDRIGCQRDGPAATAPKLVSGSVDAGEFVRDAAEREVFEEAGVRAGFAGVVACGNRLRTRFDRDELVFACLLVAEPGQPPRADGREVAEAAWWPADRLAEACPPMDREWLAAASRAAALPCWRAPDSYRGQPHLMDYYVPRLN